MLLNVKLQLSHLREHRFRVSEKKVPRGIFEPKRQELIEDWRKWHSEGLHNVYFSPDIISYITTHS
jgi:hypothetical protein